MQGRMCRLFCIEIYKLKFVTLILLAVSYGYDGGAEIEGLR
jgi:hypothetical protein